MKMPIKWHKECLANQKAHYQRERKAAEYAMKVVLDGEEKCKQYAEQIKEAERRGGIAFDRERFAIPRTPPASPANPLDAREGE